MIAIHYFASIRETLGVEHENMDLPARVSRVEHLVDHLAGLHGGKWEATLKQASVMVAVNHQVASMQSVIKAGDEIAFFPPVTGG